ncbi:MAG: hypothetical protein V9E93_16600 [Steroidobacteraceae bacterium]
MHTLGGGDTLAQRLFYCAIYPLVAFVGGGHSRPCSPATGWPSPPPACSGVFNGFFLTRLPNPLNVISVGGVVPSPRRSCWRGRRRAADARTVAGPGACCPCRSSPTTRRCSPSALAWVAAGLPLLSLLIFGRRAFVRVLRYGLLAAPWALAINVFWLVPVRPGVHRRRWRRRPPRRPTRPRGPGRRPTTPSPNVLTLSANWAWFKPQYLPFTPQLDQPWWLWLRYLLPVALFLAPVLAPSGSGAGRW